MPKQTTPCTIPQLINNASLINVFQDTQNMEHILFHTTTCSPLLKWHPDPANIQCLTKCYFYGIKDELCNGLNNNEDCFWDGGDCCDSTTPSGEAWRRPSQCPGTECACKDPNGRDYHGSGVLPSSWPGYEMHLIYPRNLRFGIFGFLKRIGVTR